LHAVLFNWINAVSVVHESRQSLADLMTAELKFSKSKEAK